MQTYLKALNLQNAHHAHSVVCVSKKISIPVNIFLQYMGRACVFSLSVSGFSFDDYEAMSTSFMVIFKSEMGIE